MKTCSGILGLLFLMTTAFVKAQDVTAYSNPVHINFKAKDITPPNISLAYKNGGMLNAEGKVEVVIRILDDGGIGDFIINEAKLNGYKADSVITALAFDPGQEVNVTAHDLSNNVKDKAFIIKAPAVLTALASSTAPQHKYYALIMGVQEYDDPTIPPLEDPVKDATKLKQVLTEKYEFDPKDVTFLENPTGDQIELAFEELGKKVTAQDFLLIFYAGHGIYDKQKNVGYWLPRDAKKGNQLRWFRNSTLVEDIAGINSLHTLLITDACFGGSLFKTREVNNATPEISEMLKEPSRKAMTSGSLTAVADKSVFMKYLLKSLSENDKKYLPADDLFYSVKQGMSNNSDQTPLFGTIQKVGDDGGLGMFVFIQKSK